MRVAISSKRWFELETRLNGQRHNPRWIQFRHDKFRIARWREIPYKDRNTLKTNINGSQQTGDRWMTTRLGYLQHPPNWENWKTNTPLKIPLSPHKRNLERDRQNTPQNFWDTTSSDSKTSDDTSDSYSSISSNSFWCLTVTWANMFCVFAKVWEVLLSF